MKITKETRRAARKLFRDCMVHERMDEEKVRALVAAVASSRPRHYLALLSVIEKLAKLDIQKRTALVESAAPLRNGQADEIIGQLQKRFAAPLAATHRVNPALIGGLRVKVGSDVWDGSIAARLNQLKIKN